MLRSKRHGPCRLRNYISVHEKQLLSLEEGGLIEGIDTLTIRAAGEGEFFIRGKVIIRGGPLVLEVQKILETVMDDDDDPSVQTAWYAYNLQLPGYDTVFRYNCPHDDDGLSEHHKFHHCHRLDVFAELPKSTEAIDTYQGHDWPTLTEVIYEADKWYWKNEARLVAIRDSQTESERASSLLFRGEQ